MSSRLWRVCFIPVFDGEDAKDVGRLEDADYLCLGVVADTAEQAIKNLKNKVQGMDLTEYIGDDEEEEKWKPESFVCEKAIVVAVSFASTIDVEDE